MVIFDIIHRVERHSIEPTEMLIRSLCFGESVAGAIT